MDPQQSPETGSLQRTADSFTSFLGGLFSWVLFPLGVVLILHFFVFQAYRVLGTSMVNTLHESDYLIISKLGYTTALIQHKAYIPKRGEIVVFHFPKDPTQTFVKRVIGVPGDRVVVQNGVLKVYNAANPQGFSPDDKYEPVNTITLTETDVTVPPGNIFVVGDNRTPGGSYDSRDWGLLPSSYIIGDAVLRLLPLDQIKVF